MTMPVAMPDAVPPTILLAGAARGLGLAMAREFLDRGWIVLGTVRPGRTDTELHALAAGAEGRVEVLQLDVTDADQLPPLHEQLAGQLAGRTLDILFVVAGTTTQDENIPIGQVSTAEFDHVMHTNALGPMRVIEALADLVSPTGLIGAMSSGQGSIANNETGLREVYRGSKAALNQFMRSFAVRQPEPGRALLVAAPGWVQTELGGPGATLTIEQSIPKLVDVILAQLGRPGVRYLDYQGRTVPW